MKSKSIDKKDIEHIRYQLYKCSKRIIESYQTLSELIYENPELINWKRAQNKERSSFWEKFKETSRK